MAHFLTLGIFALQTRRRDRRQLIAGISKVKAGFPFRVGFQMARLSINKFYAKFYAGEENLGNKNTALTWEEEETIVKKLQEKEHTDGYIPHDAIKNATKEFVNSLPYPRRRKIPFRGGRPTKTFCKRFEKRHCYVVYCEKPEKKDDIDQSLVTARDVVTYFNDIRDMVTKDKLEANNIWCLTARSLQVDIGEDDTFYKYFTMFTVTNASGNLLSYTNFAHNTDIEEAVEASDHFESWIAHVADKMEKVYNSGDSYNLMLCDESYLFMNEALREWFFKRQVIVFSVPGLSDGFAANHEVGCSSLWMEKFKEYVELDLQMRAPPKRSWNESTLLMFTHMARYASLTTRNISDSFSNAGIFPLDEVRFFKHPRPMSFAHFGKLCDIQTMCDMLDAKSSNNGN